MTKVLTVLYVLWHFVCQLRYAPCSLLLLPLQTKSRIARAEGAQQNGFENIGLYAAAVVAGNIAGLNAGTLNYLSGGYLLSRMAYNIIYITNESAMAGNARTGVFVTGIGLIMTLFVKAGNKLQPGLL